jgi:hypothetical protein
MRSTYLAWARDELLLVALLSVALLLFLTNPSLRDPYLLPSLRLFFDTAVLLVSVIVSVLAYVRFSLERRRFDLFLLGGFFVTATTTLAFAVGAALDGNPVQPAELWAGIAGKLIAAALIAAAPFAAGRVATRRWAVVYTTALPWCSRRSGASAVLWRQRCRRSTPPAASRLCSRPRLPCRRC